MGQRFSRVGCGTGRNLIHAARRWPNARFVGFDISHAMLETAWTSIARAGLSDRIDVYQADATAFDLSDLCGEAHVGRVFISYTLSMIPPWRQVLAQALEAVGPGGRLHILDFGQQEAWQPGGSRQCCSLGCVSSLCIRGRNSRPNSTNLASDTGADLEFRRLYRGYADYAVITKPGAERT